MDKKNILITAVVALGISLAVAALYPNVQVLKETVRTETKEAKLGSAQPELSSPYFFVNGIRHWYWRQDLQTATTTNCYIQSPAATSTLVSGIVAVTNTATGTPVVVTLSRGTQGSGSASTSNALGVSTISVAKGTIFASTTINAAVFPPLTWFVANFQGGNGVLSPVGTCQVEFIEAI